MSRWSLFLVLICSLIDTYCQSYVPDGIRFGTNTMLGSARYVSLGGSFSSIGGDISAISYNPASTGMFKGSLVQLSTGMHFDRVNSLYNSYSKIAKRGTFIVPSFGLILSFAKNVEKKKFKVFSLGIGLNRMGDYRYNEDFSGSNTNQQSSISWQWAEELTEVYGSSNSDVYLDDVSIDAYNSFLNVVYFDSASAQYFSIVSDSIRQKRTQSSRGGKQELFFSFGTNYKDKLYLGATVGVPFIGYKRNFRYEEEELGGENYYGFKSLKLDKAYSVSGAGINFKAGFIYKINRDLRVGIGFQTPENIGMSEEYTSELKSDFNIDGPLTGSFDYRLVLPWRWNGGMSIFFRKLNGFISLDYEMVGYSSTRYRFDSSFDDVEKSLNNEYKTYYKPGHNARLGVEILYKSLKFRFGGNYEGSPLKKKYRDKKYSFAKYGGSAGFGFMIKKFAMDFAYRLELSKQYEQAYYGLNNSVPPIFKNNVRHVALVSIALRMY